tara:strand:+ start:384 stop:728 length:345 start_codon:yes stop_codon:yes gene_type:complete
MENNLMEVNSDTMDINVSEEEDEQPEDNIEKDKNILTSRQQYKEYEEHQNHINNEERKHNLINVKELEDKVKAAMVKLQEIIVNKKKEEDSLIKLREEVDVIKRDELESLKKSK